MRPGDEAPTLINDSNDGPAFRRGFADEVAAVDPQVSRAGAGRAIRRNDGGVGGLGKFHIPIRAQKSGYAFT